MFAILFPVVIGAVLLTILSLVALDSRDGERGAPRPQATAVLVPNRTSAQPVAPPAPAAPARSFHECRILFVEEDEDEMALDCVIAEPGPLSGTPFTLHLERPYDMRIDAIVDAVISRWASDDLLVQVESVSGSCGRRFTLRCDGSDLHLAGSAPAPIWPNS
jgi:hypothetical protein